MEPTEFTEQVKNANSKLNTQRCQNIIKNSLQSIPIELNQPGTLNLVIIIEEFNEAAKEVSKFIRGKGNRNSLIEELADAYLSIKYAQEIFSISEEELNKAINVKLNRQYERNLLDYRHKGVNYGDKY